VYYDTFVLDPNEVRGPKEINFDEELYKNVPNGGVLVLRIQNEDKTKNKSVEDGDTTE